MPNVSVEQLPKSTVKLTVTVTSEELKPFLEAAAARISESTSIPGFRPGHASFEIVKGRVGEMKIYEEALESVVRKTYVDALFAHKIDTVGSPKIDVEKLAPGNDLVYTAEVARVPAVTRLADFRRMKVTAKHVEVSEQDLETTLKDLQRMQTKEIRATAADTATGQDKVVVSMDMKKDGVPVEGGQSPNHAIYLAESYYIPGLKEHIVGMKEGENKQFTLPFPKDHTQKMLAGADVQFDITLKELYRLQPPELNDAFAQTLGQKDLASMKDLIRGNIKEEKTGEETFRQEKEILESIAKDSKFEDVPELLLNEEVNKMIAELEQGVVSQGGVFEDYLKSIKKSIGDLKMDFAPQALMRVKVALILREVGKQEKIDVDEKEIDTALDEMAKQYEDADIRKRIYSPEYREYMENRLRNRKVVELLRREMIQ
jgi:trigger factor